MGVIGRTKDLLAEAKAKVAAADVEGANAAIDAANDLLGKIGQIADDVTETELIKDLDAAVESVPAEFKTLALALRGAIDHFVRVGTRASIAAQTSTQMMTEVRELIADIRQYGFETKSRIAKPLR